MQVGLQNCTMLSNPERFVIASAVPSDSTSRFFLNSENSLLTISRVEPIVSAIS
jgi:hypothetical protein